MAGVDITKDLEVNSEAVEETEQAERSPEELNVDELVAEISKADPVLGMLSAKIFDMGNVLADVVRRLEVAERVTMPIYIEMYKQQQAAKKQSETADDKQE